ncbi:DUF86 domain-containing protein [Glaciimonas sp. Gout2]|uniref:HepT-like ribonuclease domain-containing protein n=1 Tax=unclassified Glaciimonas TaxID=2644401 RepID=UPI002AB53E6E|nr:MULTISPECIES: HepT-like ribonuclease domain-containing protein [unclassified Glaciimonas]MDY7545258.1 DUF86 domain-containing protein [Glaciimonas sp. CA11.2]MEB0011229.1 DUF86 domain-containing protein [Glaciimonas sp. Cout2]MEB0080879.1 DUF86 domain-containing protein [Glaciimonas sp. Gout2]
MSRTDQPRVAEYLGHIIEAIQRIEWYKTGMTEMQFLDDEKTQDAVVRNFEIVGEACKNIIKKHPEFAAQHSEIPWGFAYEMRNALAHGYHKVDFEIVWNTIHRNLYLLLAQIEQALIKIK